ncbi:MAG: indole-3-glycerol-phosphate synthase, partial [Ruminococcus sp.]|nr:indole-3-glycerol-phosphate synthase [Ruminococcus sp.]
MTILDELAAYARERVARAKENISLAELRRMALASPKGSFAFENALKTDDIAFICECKKASPSKGLIAPDFPYLQIALDYEAAGADCISVLTEPKWFLGSNDYLKEIAENVKIPCLRKDFTVDEYMIYEAKLLGASAVLLIAAILSQEQLSKYIDICDGLGLSALVEAHDEAEAIAAINAGARIIGVNN